MPEQKKPYVKPEIIVHRPGSRGYDAIMEILAAERRERDRKDTEHR